MTKINPSIPYIFLMISISFLAFAGMFFYSPHQDWKMLTAAIIFTSLAFTFFWLIDRGYLSISYNEKLMRIKGFFFIKDQVVHHEQIEGYQLREKVDQLNGFHEEIYIVLKNGKGILFPRIAYTEDDYSRIRTLFESNLSYLGNTTIKYGRIVGRFLTIIFSLSGILAGLVGLLKAMK